jgi:hypothetical protein
MTEPLRSIHQAVWDRYGHYPLRCCRSLHTCALCESDIRLGEMYFDGGYGRRAHEDCVLPPSEKVDVKNATTKKGTGTGEALARASGPRHLSKGEH